MARLRAALLAVALAVGGPGAQEPPRARVPEPIPLLDGDPALGRWIALSGETTQDPEGQPEAYEWRQLEGPAPRFFEAQVQRPRVWMLLEQPGKYGFALRARNKHGWSEPARLLFSVPETPPPIPLAQALLAAGAGERITLPGEAWRQLYGPAVSLKVAPGGRETEFRALQPGLYLFEALHAGDQPERRAVWIPPGRDELVGDRRPLAVLPGPLHGRAGEPLTLDASLSNDPDGADERLEANWEADLVFGASLVRQGPLKARFLGLREGVYRLRLTVSDGELESTPLERFIHLAPPATAAVAAEARASSHPLDRRVTLRLYESSLDGAVQKFPGGCNVVLRVDKQFCPPERLVQIPIHAAIEEGTVRLLADWIAFQTDSFYRWEAPGALWLTTSTAWAADEKLESVVCSADALHRRGDASELLALLKECFAGVLAARPDATLAFRQPEDQVVAVLPLTAAARLREIVGQLRAPKGLGLPMPLGREAEEQLFRRTLGEKTVSFDWRQRRLDLLLRDLSEAAGLSVGFDPRQFSGGLPRLTLKLQGVPLREAAREVVAAAPFDGCQPVASGGLWFYRGAEPYPSGELYWDVAQARAYDLDVILARLPMLSGEAVAYQVRRRVFADSWRVSGAFCAFHPPTGKLLVVHGPAAHERVLDFLWDLAVRGEWALGPAVTLTPDGKEQGRRNKEQSRE